MNGRTGEDLELNLDGKNICDRTGKIKTISVIEL